MTEIVVSLAALGMAVLLIVLVRAHYAYLRKRKLHEQQIERIQQEMGRR